MRKLKLFSLLAALCCSMIMWAGDYVDGIYYEFDATTHTASVGDNRSYSGAISIPSSVSYQDQDYTVTSIGESAFQENLNLTSVTLPNTITSIESLSFNMCENLTSVTLSNTLESIGYGAFSACRNLSSITALPSTLTSIGEAAFVYCAFTSLTIPNSVTTIGPEAFFHCEQLTSIDLPNTLTELPYRILGWCKNLSSVDIPASVTKVGEDAFIGCSSLTSVTIPANVSVIEQQAFCKCTHLQTLNILPVSPVDIGSYVVKECATNLVINIPACDGLLAHYQSEFSSWVSIVSSLPCSYGVYPYEDPINENVYYSTFFDGNNKYELPTGVEAYVADLSDNALALTKIASATEVIPANTAVILKANSESFTLSASSEDAVTFTAENDLKGVNAQTALASAPGYSAGCTFYVLYGDTEDGVGFYEYTGENIVAHKAYVVVAAEAGAPKRLRFAFETATGVENVQGDKVQSTKVLRDGQLIIIRNGVEYNANGMMVK